ncbi:N/A [soil metagenome]
MSNRRIAASGVFWNIVQTVGERFFQTLVFFVVARLLQPTAFGLAAMAVAPAAVFAAVMQGASQVIVQEKDLTDSIAAAAFWFNVAAGVLLGFLIFVGAEPISELVSAPAMAPLMMATACVPVVAGLGAVSQGIMTRRLEFRMLAIRRTIGVTLAGLSCAALAWLGFGAWSLVIQTILTAAIMSIVALVAERVPLFERFSKGEFGLVARRSGLLCGSTALIQGNTRLADLVVGYFTGPAGAGAFRLARTIIDLILSLTFTPLGNVLLPIFANAKEEPERAFRMFVKIVVSSSLLFSGVEICTIFGAESFRRLFLGSSWPGLSWVLIFLAPLLPTMSVSPGQALLIIDNKSGAVFGANAARLVASTTCLALGSWLGGINGAAIGYTVCTYLAQISLLLFLNRQFPLLSSLLRWSMLKSQIFGLIIGFCGYKFALNYGLRPENLVESVLASLVALASFMSLCWVFCRRELRVVLDVVPMPKAIKSNVEKFLL